MKPAGVDVELAGFEPAVREKLKELEEADLFGRLWKKDPSIWQTEPDRQEIIMTSLGWLDAPKKFSQSVANLSEFLAELKKAGFRHVLLLGAGGSSLAPLVFSQTFGRHAPGLPLTVLDTVDPAAVARVERNLPLANTFFIEADKSGTTLESRSLGEYFLERVKSIKVKSACENFAAITDPGSILERLAIERAYRKVFLNSPDIGECYSALSCFGLVPAALMGIDLEELLVRASKVMNLCRTPRSLSTNPGAVLGAAVGVLASAGRDKLTFLLPAPFRSFGMWLEQLIAESTGKNGTGIVPVRDDPLENVKGFGGDRLFVEFRIKNEPDEALKAKARSLSEAGHPVITVHVRDRLDVGEQFFLWEIAAATAGASLLINPFDRPDVMESEHCTARILDEVREKGRVPEGVMEMSLGPLRLYPAGGASSVPQALSMFFEGLTPGAYVGILAYLTEDEASQNAIQRIRTLISERTKIATSACYGPRYLHSSGQLHKGGPDGGFFLLLTQDIREDAGIPGQPYTFGMLMRAMALGDFEALRKRRRRVLRVHLSADAVIGLAALEAVLGDVIKFNFEDEKKR